MIKETIANMRKKGGWDFWVSEFTNVDFVISTGDGNFFVEEVIISRCRGRTLRRITVVKREKSSMAMCFWGDAWDERGLLFWVGGLGARFGFTSPGRREGASHYSWWRIVFLNWQGPSWEKVQSPKIHFWDIGRNYGTVKRKDKGVFGWFSLVDLGLIEKAWWNK